MSALNRKGLQQHLKKQIIDMDKNYYTIFFIDTIPAEYLPGTYFLN